MWTKVRGAVYCSIALYVLVVSVSQRHMGAQSSMRELERRVTVIEASNIEARLARIDTQIEVLKSSGDRSYNLNVVLLTCVLPLLLEMAARMLTGMKRNREAE